MLERNAIIQIKLYLTFFASTDEVTVYSFEMAFTFTMD